MDIEFIPVDLSQSLALCMQFRKDAWVASFGTEQGFSEQETLNWFHRLISNHPAGFLHLRWQGRIIGQVEFQSGIETSDGLRTGYINLFYLVPEVRGTGLGQQLHDKVLKQIQADRCDGAMLRYIPGNLRAERFYLKNGWYPVGEPEAKRGQLMRLDFESIQ
ncbi:GNAT family N-acetyltransferase [Endozoicomonadaceae bacterium StTr2]